MLSRRSRMGYFVLEGLNSLGSVYFLYYLYFFMQKEYGFGNRANLALATLLGLVYAVMSWQAGRLAQRFGYFAALKLGFGVMITGWLMGSQLHTLAGHVAATSLAMAGTCFIWPALEALVTERESPRGVQRMVGIYNMVWSGTAALAYFAGGAVFEKLGPRSVFYVPLAIAVSQFCLTLWIQATAEPPSPLPSHDPAAHAGLQPANPRAKGFLRMAWLANPFAYVAINTLVAVMPGVASRLGLSPMAAGFCCSLWCFSRMGSFMVLWGWAGWHYRFRWLLVAYMTLVGTFAAIVMAPGLRTLILAQLAFGIAAGLIYYSSLFYSMDLGDAKGEHGGIHEAAIGLGNFAGPAVGAACQQLLPAYSNSGALAVTALLLLGLGGLLTVWRRACESTRVRRIEPP
jgi:predicted MFS family arabinose efflux permease